MDVEEISRLVGEAPDSGSRVKWPRLAQAARPADQQRRQSCRENRDAPKTPKRSRGGQEKPLAQDPGRISSRRLRRSSNAIGSPAPTSACAVFEFFAGLYYGEPIEHVGE